MSLDNGTGKIEKIDRVDAGVDKKITDSGKIDTGLTGAYLDKSYQLLGQLRELDENDPESLKIVDCFFQLLDSAADDDISTLRKNRDGFVKDIEKLLFEARKEKVDQQAWSVTKDLDSKALIIAGRYKDYNLKSEEVVNCLNNSKVILQAEKMDCKTFLKDEILAFLVTSDRDMQSIWYSLLNEEGNYDYLGQFNQYKYRDDMNIDEIQAKAKNPDEITRLFFEELEKARIEYWDEAKVIMSSLSSTVDKMILAGMNEVEARMYLRDYLMFVPLNSWKFQLKALESFFPESDYLKIGNAPAFRR